MENLRSKAIKGVFWSSFERISVQSVTFIVQIILARLLTPADYGIVGMLAIFMAIANTLVESGFSSALVQKTNRDNIDYSTIFYFNVSFSLILYIILYLLAPVISDFYDQPILENMTKVISFIIIINSLSVVQRARFNIALDFKTLSKASLFAIVISGGLGIYFAYIGYGVWALVIQQLANSLINLIMLWICSRWCPSPVFSFERLKKLFNYGSKLLLSSLIYTLYSNIYILVIGKVYSPKQLGYYTRGSQFVMFPFGLISQIINRVFFPILCEYQENNKRMIAIYERMMLYQTMAGLFISIIIICLSDSLIITVLTDKWIGVVWIMKILLMKGVFMLFNNSGLLLLKAIGKSNIYLKVEFLSRFIGTLLLFLAINFGFKFLIVSESISTIIFFCVLMIYLRKEFSYKMKYFLKNINKVFIAFVITLIICGGVLFSVDNHWFKILLGVGISLLVYTSILFYFKLLPLNFYKYVSKNN